MAAPLLALLLAAARPLPVCDAVWHDMARDRNVPVRIHMPAPPDVGGGGGAPVILYSPGLGGDARSGSAWARAWVDAGFAVVAMAHAGSDGAVYAGKATPEQRRARIIAATTPAQQQARIGDAGFVIDELLRRKVEGACDLEQLNPDRIAIAGHSMGAWTAQALAGQRFGNASVADPRIKAAVLMSSTGPSGAAAKAAFGAITIPVMVVTGTRDGVAADATPAASAAALAQRTAAYDGMPADGRKYLLVVAGAEHMMFDGRTLPAGAAPLPRHVQSVVADLTVQFFATWLTRDQEAAATIALPRPPALAPADRFDRK